MASQPFEEGVPVSALEAYQTRAINPPNVIASEARRSSLSPPTGFYRTAASLTLPAVKVVRDIYRTYIVAPDHAPACHLQT